MTAAISRSSDHRYTFDGVTYPGVTSILKVLDKSDALMAWAARNTAEAAVALAQRPDTKADGTVTTSLNHLLEEVGPEGTVKALTSRSSWKRDEAASLGTEVHRLADLVTSAPDTELTITDDGTRKRVHAYAEWWATSGWTLRLSEAAVVHPLVGYGGTFDLLAKDRDGKTVLADIKTGKGVYREAALQLTAYGMAVLVSPFGSEVAYPMPLIDRYVILHVTVDGVREIEVPVGKLEEAAFMACVDLHRWAETTKGKRL